MPSYVKVVSDLEYNTLPSPASRKRLAAAVSGKSDNSTAASTVETNKDTEQEKMIHEGAPSLNDTKLPPTNTTNNTTNPSNNTAASNDNSSASNNTTAAAGSASDITVNNNINIDNSNYSQAAVNWADKMKHKSTTNTTVAANNTTFTNDTVSDELAAQLTAQPATTQQQDQINTTAAINEPIQQPQIGTSTANKSVQHAPTDWYHRHNKSRHSQISNAATTTNGTNNGLAPTQQPHQQQNGKVQKVNKKSKSNKSIAEQALAALNDDDHSSSSSSEEEGGDGDENEDILLNEAAGVLNGVNKESGRDSVESDNNSIITQPPSDETVRLNNNVNGRLSSKGAVDMNGVAAAVNAVQEMDVDTIEQLSSVDNNKDSSSSSMEVDKNDGDMEVINIDDDDEEEDNTNSNSSSTNNSSNNNNTNRYNSSNLTKEQAEAIEHAFSGIKSHNQTDVQGFVKYKQMLEEKGIINNSSTTTAKSSNNKSNSSSTSVSSTTTKTLFNIGPLSNEYKKKMVLPENYTRSLMVILKELAVTLADMVGFFLCLSVGFILWI